MIIGKNVFIMTKVSITDSYRIPGIYEPIEYIVETHTICDKCGSADISYKGNAHLPGLVNLGFSLVSILAFYGGLLLAFGEMLLGFFKYNHVIYGLWIVSGIALIVFWCLTAFVERNNSKNPKCSKCGNERIT